jgi:hypothetical protein
MQICAIEVDKNANRTGKVHFVNYLQFVIFTVLMEVILFDGCVLFCTFQVPLITGTSTWRACETMDSAFPKLKSLLPQLQQPPFWLKRLIHEACKCMVMFRLAIRSFMLVLSRCINACWFPFARRQSISPDTTVSHSMSGF